jgi:gamma-glutamyl-gamma-aminobutyrate hydrolase PuuD
VALESTIPVFGVAAGVVYLWLIFAGTSDGSILKSHRIQCTEKVKENVYFSIIQTIRVST